jgi:hypothetical protein
LDLRVAGLGIRQDFTNKVYEMLHLEGMSLFLPFYHQGGATSGGHDVEQEWLPVGR